MHGKRFLAGLILLCPVGVVRADAESKTPDPVPLWAGVAPGVSPKGAPDSPYGRHLDAVRVTDVAVPTLTRYAPGKADGRALIVCPGGGYNLLAVEAEGDAVAKRFARDGLTVFVLRYRVPEKKPMTPDCAPRADLAEALRKVRATMIAEGFAKPAVGVLGFSAGGHLVLESGYGAMPEGAPRPDFVVAVYAAYLADGQGGLKAEFAPVKGSPPACFVSTGEDAFPTAPDYELWRKLRDVGAVSELHLFARGKHGFGISPKTEGLPVSAWPDVVERWMRSPK